MNRSVALLLVLFFLSASCLMAKPALSSEAMAENSWVSKAPMQVARSGLGVAAVNGKIYAIGGYAENGVVGTNEEYDPEMDTWTFKKSMPTPMSEFATAVYQNKIYCIRENVNEVYDPATDTWETKTHMATAQWVTQANVVGDEIYTIGGTPNKTLNQVYDPEKDSWVAGAGIPTRHLVFGVAVVNDTLFVIGGSTETFDMFWNSHIALYAANEQYTPFGYGKPDPSYDGAAPEIAVASPETKPTTRPTLH